MRLHATRLAALTVAAAAFLIATNASAFTPADIAGAKVKRSDVVLAAQPKKPPQRYWRTKVRFRTNEAPGTVIVDTNNKYLYYIDGPNRATRYGIGAGPASSRWAARLSGRPGRRRRKCACAKRPRGASCR